MVNIKMVAPRRTMDLDCMGLDVVKNMSQLIGVLQHARQTGWQHKGTLFLVVLFPHQVKTLGLTFSDCTGNGGFIFVFLLNELC
jgi:hypothetical protein